MTIATTPPGAAEAASGEAPAPATKPPLAARAIGSSAWSIANQIFQVVLGLASFAVLSRWLTPGDYGRLGLAATVTSFVGIIGDAGIGYAIIRLPTIDATAEATGFWLSLAGAGVLTVVCALAAPVIAWFYRDSTLMPLAFGLATTFLLAAPGRVSNAKLYREFRLRAITVTGIASNLAAAALAVVLATRGFGTWALALQMLATLVVATVFVVVLAPPRLRGGFSRARARELGTLASQLSGYNMAITMARSLDSILAGRFLGSAAVGLMTLAQRLVFIPAERLSVATFVVFLPTIVELGKGTRQARAFYSAVRLLTMLVAPLCLGTIAIAPELVAWLPPKWASLAPVLRVYAVGTLFAPFNQLCSSVLVAHGRASLMLRISLALIPVTWGAAALAVMSGSVPAMGAAWGLGLGVSACTMLFFVWRILELKKDFFAQVLTPLAGSVAMAVAVRLVLHAAGLQGHRSGLVVGAAVGVIVYAAFAWIWLRADILRTVDLLKQSRARKKAEAAT